MTEPTDSVPPLMPPKPQAANEPNLCITGDDARFLLSLIFAPETKIPGPYALRVGFLIKVLNDLSEVQPPQRPQFM